MSYEEDKRDKIITKKVNDFRLWKHSHNLKNENIIMKANRNQSKIKQYSNELNEEENTKNQKKTKNSQKVSKNSVQFDSSTNLSETVQKIVTDVSKTIKNINKSTEEIRKLNALYLINTTQKINKKESNSLPPIDGKKHPANIKYINDNYRRQLNKAFLNFNPIIHLGNLNILRKADPEINSDIEKLTKHIDEDLVEITNKNYYHNQYKKIVQQNRKRKLKNDNIVSIQTTMPTIETHQSTQIQKKIIRKKIKNRQSIEMKLKKKFPEKELEEKTLDLMSNALNRISNTLSNENMNRYYSDYAKMGAIDIRQQAHQYFPGLTKAADILKEIQNEKNIKDIVEKANKRKKVLHTDNEVLVKEIYDAKKNLLRDIEKQEKL